MEFLINNTKNDQKEFTLLDGELEMIIPKLAIPNVSSRLTLSRPTTQSAEPEPPPQVLVRAMSKLSLYRLQEMAQKDLQAGNVHRATQRLRNLATQLLSSGESDLAQTVMLELDSIHTTRIMSEDAKKRIKYGTRALVLEHDIEESQS
jgi:Ca-activated chloride channel family protein